MPIDPATAIGAELGRRSFAWAFSDVILYHLGIGAGGDPLNPRELRYVYEKDLHVLPTFATAIPDFRDTEPPRISFPGIAVDLRKAVLGIQSLEVHQPIPTAGRAIARERIADVFDKGSGALILKETAVTDEQGRPFWTSVMSIFARGEGGFGGQRGPSHRIAVPARPPDIRVDTHTLPQQALLYRLCGDRNPMHVDPDLARAEGFGFPFLHGLCTYGIVAKAVVDAALDSQVRRVKSWTARFVGPVRPGETLRTSIWREPDRFIANSRSVERDVLVLEDAVLIAHADTPAGRDEP